MKSDHAALQQENASLKKDYEDVSQGQKDLYSRMEALEAQNKDLLKEHDKDVKTTAALRSSLDASFADIKTLKTNFESYLESLVSSFEERRK